MRRAEQVSPPTTQLPAAGTVELEQSLDDGPGAHGLALHRLWNLGVHGI